MTINHKAVEDSFREIYNQEASQENNQAKEVNNEPIVENEGTVTPSTETAVSKSKLPDGREVDVNQAIDEYKKLLADYTPKSQELAELRKEIAALKAVKEEPKEPIKSEPEDISSQDQAILAELKRVGAITKDQLDELKQQLIREAAQEAAKFATSRAELKVAMDELIEDYPFINQEKVLSFVANNANPDITLLDAAKATHMDDFIRLEAEKFKLPPKAELPSTEASGVGATEPPQPKYNFKNGSAERAIAELLKGN